MSAMQDELNALVYMIEANLADLDRMLAHASPDELELADALVCRQILAGPSLSLVREQLDNLVGTKLGRYETTVPGFGVVRRHSRKSRTKWDKDQLLIDVKDSRIFDRDGTMKDESPLDKVLHVFNLPAPRITALKDRGLDPSDYCAEEVRPGWTIQTL